ncbi:hypothetical protein [uncultured Shewanella sp.]|uniref:hypothetical protein n=1 Tax=uncultured Shewanella sp. TaxID=173975 RepID=UPI00261F9D0C|nr:hypothetical protein [uncultured Shewanella sp.]
MTTNYNNDTIELLKSVCCYLGDNWFFNDVKTREFINNYRNGQVWLDDRKGIFIQLSSAYRKELPQFSLCFEQSNARYLNVFHSIGCSLKKSPKAIAADLNKRLLIHYDDVLNKKEAMLKEHTQKRASYQLRQNIIHSISKIIPLENQRHGGGNKYYIPNFGALDHKIDEDEKFRLSIHTLNAEQLIKIYQIMTEK